MPKKGFRHTDATKKKISLYNKLGITGMLGRRHTQVTRQKMSLSARNCSAYTMAQRKQHLVFARQCITPESIEKMKISHIGKPVSEATRLRFKQMRAEQVGAKHPLFGKHHSKEARKKISEATKKHWADSEYKKRTSQSMKESLKRRWQNDEYRNKVIKAMVKASFVRPNGAEVKLGEIINEVCPNEYLYNGDGKVIINRYVPDFINVNGQKKLIELFGNYWHSKRITGKAENKEERDKIAGYAKLGYICLVVWERELKDKEKVVAKIKEFNTLEALKPKLKTGG